MITIMVTLKALFLLFGVWFTIINTTRVYGKFGVSAGNFLFQAIGIVGFLFIQFEMWKM
jgi:hypothetical protein